MIHRNIEKSLNLVGMQINCDHAVSPGDAQKVGNHLGGKRDPWLFFLVLPAVAVVGNYYVNPMRGCPFEGIYDHQQFHQIFIDRRTGGLEHVSVFTPDVFAYFHPDFSVTEAGDEGFARTYPQPRTNLIGKGGVGISGKKSETAPHNGNLHA